MPDAQTPEHCIKPADPKQDCGISRRMDQLLKLWESCGEQDSSQVGNWGRSAAPAGVREESWGMVLLSLYSPYWFYLLSLSVAEQKKLNWFSLKATSVWLVRIDVEGNSGTSASCLLWWVSERACECRTHAIFSYDMQCDSRMFCIMFIWTSTKSRTHPSNLA